MIVYRLTDSGVERLEVAYVVPGLVHQSGETITHPDGTLVVPSRHPSIPRPEGDDWYGRFPNTERGS